MVNPCAFFPLTANVIWKSQRNFPQVRSRDDFLDIVPYPPVGRFKLGFLRFAHAASEKLSCGANPSLGVGIYLC